jgi:hypothetical protein
MFKAKSRPRIFFVVTLILLFGDIVGAVIRPYDVHKDVLRIAITDVLLVAFLLASLYNLKSYPELFDALRTTLRLGRTIEKPALNPASAGIRAGAIAGLPLGIGFTVFFAMLNWKALLAETTRMAVQFGYAPSASDAVAVEVISFLLIVSVAASGLFGALAGRAFVGLVRHMPGHSNYIKAITFGLCLWLLPSPMFLQNDPRLYFVFFLPLFLLEAIMFAHLFDRWTTPKLVHSRF